jgi:hypothetical protein
LTLRAVHGIYLGTLEDMGKRPWEGIPRAVFSFSRSAEAAVPQNGPCAARAREKIGHGDILMTDILTDHTKNLAEAEDSARHALKALEVAIDVLESSVDALRQDVRSGEKDLVGSLKAMNNAYQFAQAMKEKARDAGSEKYGRTERAAFDLNAARAEVGLRLASLRAASDGGGVPGEPE